MSNIFINVLKLYHGFGDEIVYVNKIINEKQRTYPTKFVNIFELFSPIERPTESSRKNYCYKSNLLENPNYKTYFSEELTEKDLDQSLWYTNTLENKKNKLQKINQGWEIFKIIEPRFFTKKKLQVRHILLNLIHEYKWEAIILQNHSIKVITENTHDKDHVEILNIINFLHKSFQQKLIFKGHTWHINFDSQDKEFIKNNNIHVRGNVYGCDNNLMLEYQESLEKNNNISVIQTGHVNNRHIQHDHHHAFAVFGGDNFHDLNASYKSLQHHYIYANFLKGIYKKDISWIKNDISNLGYTVDYIPRYDHYEKEEFKKNFSLRNVSNTILKSKFAIGGEGGHMHVALYGGVPYLCVLPDEMIKSFKFNGLRSIMYSRPEVTILKFNMAMIINRFPISKLFWTTEEDLVTNLENIILKMNHRVDFLQDLNYNYIEDFFNFHIITNNGQSYKNIKYVYKNTFIEYLQNDSVQYFH